MRKLILLIVIFITWLPSFAQESMETIMGKRAKEMIRVIDLTDKEQYKKFIKENYSEAFINKPMKATVETSESDGTSTSGTENETSEAANIEGKAGMFGRLHDDFGDSKVISTKITADKLVMVVEGGSGIRGTFTLKFSTAQPYLIDGLGIEVGN
jgi:hypothetical protein